jgi:hypothetical protein
VLLTRSLAGKGFFLEYGSACGVADITGQDIKEFKEFKETPFGVRRLAFGEWAYQRSGLRLAMLA